MSPIDPKSYVDSFIAFVGQRVAVLHALWFVGFSGLNVQRLFGFAATDAQNASAPYVFWASYLCFVLAWFQTLATISSWWFKRRVSVHKRHARFEDIRYIKVYAPLEGMMSSLRFELIYPPGGPTSIKYRVKHTTLLLLQHRKTPELRKRLRESLQSSPANGAHITEGPNYPAALISEVINANRNICDITLLDLHAIATFERMDEKAYSSLTLQEYRFYDYVIRRYRELKARRETPV